MIKNRRYIASAFAAAMGATIAFSPARAADVILNGNFLRVGVNDSGGLIDSGFTVGIDYDKTGTSSWTGFDFLKPGTPYEFYSVGYNDTSAQAGYYYGNPLGSTTTDTSAGGILSTHTAGGVFGSLGLKQDLSYAAGSGFIDFSVTLTNMSDVALSKVVYARGLDPDQDVYAGGGYPTTNIIQSGDLVTGSAPITDWTIGIFSNSAYAHTPTIQSNWPNGEPYHLLTPHNDGNGDWSINMAWDIGTLAAGASATIDFQYRIAQTKGGVTHPGVPDSTSTLGLLGLGIAALAASRFRRRA